MTRLSQLLLIATLTAGLPVVVGCRDEPKSATRSPVSNLSSTFVSAKENSRAVGDVLSSLKAELVTMSADYPELAGAKDSHASESEFVYEHDCRYLGKRGYEDTGPRPVAIGLRVESIPELSAKAGAYSLPLYRWPSLNMVGWPTLHVGENLSPDLSGDLNALLTKHGKMIDELDRLAAESGR